MSNAGQFKPIARGPQVGAPPSLEFVAIERLQVDPAYQRATDGPHSRRILVGMVKEWKWALCQPLVIARRDDGSLMILDGQHRHAGATERGDIAHLPCVILPAIGTAEEARAFVELNTKRQRLTQADIFHGMLAAGDEHAKEAADLLAETGWRIVRSTNTQAWKPGDLDCAPMIVRQLRTHGASSVRAALQTLREAYPTETVTGPATLINALVHMFRPGSPIIDERARLVAAMKPISAAAWRPRADKHRLASPDASVRDAVVFVLLRAAGLASLKSVTPPPAAALSTPRKAIRENLFANESGRAWCAQCEQRVDPAKARACASPFCKLKASNA